ncbi:CIA30 family protein [Flavobacterium sp. LMO6]|uniref:CIA30 family protein n=2 Tax=Flavobacterium TaxID=237 RepID=UPI001EF0C9B3|nr:CIA30 family protein [Flavobacterium sp. LMO6]
MKLTLLLLLTFMNTTIIFDFNKSSSISNWKIIDDGVMGGLSQGRFSINNDGNGVFEGAISLENNGGFSSVRHTFNKINVNSESIVRIRLKGDGKAYQFRIKDKNESYFSYITTFQTSGEWQTIDIKLTDLYPSYRGRRLNLPNFNNDSFEEIVFLIGNKKNESFKLLLDKIELK